MKYFKQPYPSYVKLKIKDMYAFPPYEMSYSVGFKDLTTMAMKSN
jgi:hypothetical protein